MLKSLLGYHSGAGGGATETIVRKKVYQSAIDNTLKNNFPVVQKVGVSEERDVSAHRVNDLVVTLL